MGRGDRSSRKGKLWRKSYGNTRRRKDNKPRRPKGDAKRGR